METRRVCVARSIVDTYRVRVHNRTSVGVTVARRAYRPAPYLCRRRYACTGMHRYMHRCRIDMRQGYSASRRFLTTGDHASISYTARKR
ncbi:hypothetical protein EVAR_43660_1 [Eumeta japonica]|uniref:Uncharacterized protein n=1 Tax=Eumeta variegata TaxID=151549 RepID=A0A4C1XYM2_EUMVA|nr:hypothetical protein EVAR_43660_1 [Eumeta japonica]